MRSLATPNILIEASAIDTVLAGILDDFNVHRRQSPSKIPIRATGAGVCPQSDFLGYPFICICVRQVHTELQRAGRLRFRPGGEFEFRVKPIVNVVPVFAASFKK